MANFEVKYRTAAGQTASEMVSAPDDVAAGKAFAAAHPHVSPNDIYGVKAIGSRGYGAASFVTTLVSFGGWALLVLGVIGVFVGLSTAQSFSYPFAPSGLDRTVGIAAGYAVAMFSLLLAILGLLMAALGQHLRATTDTARYLADISALMRMKS